MSTMHRMNHQPQAKNGPQTTGRVLHTGENYDHFSGLFGIGVNGRNSRMLVEMAKIKPGDRVLDVGCGTGNLTLTAKNYAGPSGAVYGIDASPEMIAAAQKKTQRTGSEAVFEVALIEKIPYPDASFDVVINRLVMHHLPDELKRQAFAEILRVLKPGGLFFIADFNPPGNPVLAHLFLTVLGHQMMQTDMRLLLPMLKQAGFVDISSGPTRSFILGYVSGKKTTA